MGLSVPNFVRIASMSVSEASTPAITRAGSPGITRITRKTMVEMSSTVSMRRPNRLTVNNKIFLSFQICNMYTISLSDGSRLPLKKNPSVEPKDPLYLKFIKSNEIFSGVRSLTDCSSVPVNRIRRSRRHHLQNTLFSI